MRFVTTLTLDWNQVVKKQVLYHLCYESQWMQAGDEVHYTPESLKTEGYVHLSPTPESALSIANQFYPVRKGDDLLLTIWNIPKDDPPLRWEQTPLGVEFPHYYARLPRSYSVVVYVLKRVGVQWEMPAD